MYLLIVICKLFLRLISMCMKVAYLMDSIKWKKGLLPSVVTFVMYDVCVCFSG